MGTYKLEHGDCLELLRAMPENSVDMVFCSPPYEAARRYGALGFNLRGQEWVDWAFERYMECVRVCRGLVAWIAEGQTNNFQWSATPALLIADLHRAGVKMRKPPIFKRVGIPGSGGPDWWRNDYEFAVCSTKGKLPWSDNKATGKPPKYGPGGDPSHHGTNGRVSGRKYRPPKICNPGNIIECHGGGGHMGSKLAHENEAPFPESLVLPFILSFCPPGGTVLDPFCGSGTTLAVAVKNGRNAIGMDIRLSQMDLSNRRMKE